MLLPIPNKVEKLWDAWHLRGCIILSLFLQAFLVWFASWRRRSKSTLLLFLIWSAYLLADWVAAVSIGAIIKGQVDLCDPAPPGTDALFAFWASFLLLHLGGPDSITSFALEDNELWLRHLQALVLQGLAVAYGIFLTLPNNKLWLPTMLLFVVGIIKYGERTYSLYLASLQRIADSSATALSALQGALARAERTRTNIPSSTSSTTSHDHQIGEAEYSYDNIDLSRGVRELCESLKSLDEMTLLELAHKLFPVFRGLMVNVRATNISLQATIRKSFLEDERTTSALRVIEYELSMLYEVLHTKVVVARRKVGYVFRFISFCFIVGALAFFFSVEKHSSEHRRFDVGLTYALLISAVALDSFSFVHFVSSDWTLGAFKGTWKRYVPSVVVKRRRWSESIFQYNLISYCLDEHPYWLYNFRGYLGKGILEKLKFGLFSSLEIVTEELKLSIFAQLKAISENFCDEQEGMEACYYRGQWTLKSSSYDKLKWSVSKFQYPETLLLWHLATELIVYCRGDQEKQSATSSTSSTNANGRSGRTNKRICKLLSDYMFYLMLMGPPMMSPVSGNWGLVFQDTCAEAKRFFHKYKIWRDDDHLKACEKIFSIETISDKSAAEVKGNYESKSLLFDACKLAKELRELEEGPWAVMDRMWVELMCYAAINCEPTMHAQRPGKGGELLSFTWLLMCHLGFGFISP